MSTRSRYREERDEFPPTRSKCITCLCFSWKVFTCIFSHVTLIALVVAYCVFGAFLFESLEKENEEKVSKIDFFYFHFILNFSKVSIFFSYLWIILNYHSLFFLTFFFFDKFSNFPFKNDD